jgi:hypothetical protein
MHFMGVGALAMLVSLVVFGASAAIAAVGVLNRSPRAGVVLVWTAIVCVGAACMLFVLRL